MKAALQQPREKANRSLNMALAAAQVAEENQGREVVVLDLRPLTQVFDYFIVITGASRRQIHAIGDEIDRVLQQQFGAHRLGVEGYDESRWLLLDYGSIVVHVFDHETRQYYALEDLWAGAASVPRTPATPVRPVAPR